MASGDRKIDGWKTSRYKLSKKTLKDEKQKIPYLQ